MNIVYQLLIISYIKSIALVNNIDAKSLVAMDYILKANLNRTSEYIP